MDIGGTLTARYGPLPGWAWAGIAAGAGYFIIRRRNAGADTTAADGADTTTTYAGSGSAGVGDTGGDYYPASYSGPTPTPLPPKVNLGGVTVKVPNGALAPRYKLYVVRKGDSRAGLEKRFHITDRRLVTLNPILKTRPHIHPGETLLIG